MFEIGKPLLDVLSSKEVFAALLGAFVGGLTTYWATSFQEKRKQRKLELSLSSLVLTEILANLASVQYALDRVLPLWLKRKRDGYVVGFSHVYQLENTSVLGSKIYDQYFATLATTNLGILLITHYNRQQKYNFYASQQPYAIDAGSLQDYVHTSALMIEGCIDLVDRLRVMKGMRRIITDQHSLDMEAFDSQKPRAKFLAALSRVDENVVWDLIKQRPTSTGLPKDLLEASADQLRNWVE